MSLDLLLAATVNDQREGYRSNRRDVRTKERLAARIAECRDPVIRVMLECYRNGESVERIARAAGMGEEQVRGILKG